MTTACIWAALADARRAVAEVVADGRGEAPTQRGGVREFSYPTAQAVAAAATPALLGAGLMLVPLRVDAVTNGLGGAELPIVFALVHAEADEVLEFPLVWPLANPADYAGGRPQAQAATITMAECHLLRHLLAIRVREPETAAVRHGKTLDDLGAMPAWSAGPPAELVAEWREAASREAELLALRAQRETPREPECTGLMAVWCPVHGDCKCPRNASGERDHDCPSAEECPLHGITTTHPRRPWRTVA